MIVNGEDLTRYAAVSRAYRTWLVNRSHYQGFATFQKTYGFLCEILFGIASQSAWDSMRYYICDCLAARCFWTKSVKIFVDVTEMIDFNVSELAGATRGQSFFRLSRTDPSVGFSFDWDTFCGHTYPPTISNYGFPSLLHKRLFLGSHLASFIRIQILGSYNHTCSAGISTSKLTAKLAGCVNKPDKQTLLLPGFEAQFLGEHEIGKIPGIGCKTAQKIRDIVLGNPPDPTKDFEYGEVLEEVTANAARACLTSNELETLVGGGAGLGQRMWGWLHGIDGSKVVEASTVPTRISIEDTFRPGKLKNLTELTLVLHQLTTKLLQRMHLDLIAPGGEKWFAYPRNFRLSVRFHQKNSGLSRISKSAIMPRYVFSLTAPIEVSAEKLMKEVALGLFKKLCIDKVWELHIVNVAAVNMVEGSGGGDIREMFTSMKESQQGKDDEHLESNGDRRKDYEEKEEEDEWEDGDDRDGCGDFEDSEPCRLCGAKFPVFAIEAHRRFHDLDEI